MTSDTDARIRAAVDALADAIIVAIREGDEARANTPERLYDLRQAAALLGGLSRSALYEGPIARGELRTCLVGRRRMVSESAITTFIDGLKAAGGGH